MPSILLAAFSFEIEPAVVYNSDVKYLLAAAWLGTLILGGCRPSQDSSGTMAGNVMTTVTGTNTPVGVMQTVVATDTPSFHEVPASPSRTPTKEAPSGELTTLSAQVTPVIPGRDDYALEMVSGGFEQPVYLTNASDGSGRLFVVEQGGAIRIIQDGSILPAPFLDLSERVTRRSSEQGLLGLAFDPKYADSGYFFVHYSDLKGDTVVMRFSVSDDSNQADPGSGAQVLKHPQPYRNHNGGQIAFGPDGYLYIGLGDGGWAGDPRDNGQDLLTWLGAILRVDVSQSPGYALPPDNPFLSNDMALPEIWAYGLRNPWRFSFDRVTGDLYIGDVGQNEWEEIDFQPAGSRGAENYGWRRMEGGHCYKGGCESDNYVAPIAEYHQSYGGCSVTGGYVYRGESLNGLRGIYVYGDYCSGIIWALLQTEPGEWTNTEIIESGLNISSFGEDEFGEVYVVDHGGGIFKLRHASE